MPAPLNPPENAPWDQFVGKIPGGDILQTTAWGETKKALGFKVGQVVVSRDGEITSGGQIVVKHISTLGGIGYIARGPLLARRHLNEAALLLDQIEAWSRTNRVRHLIVQPGEGADEIEAALELRGYFGNAPAVAPTATFRIDLSQSLDRILGRMSRGRRRDISVVQRGEIDVRISSEAELDAFCTLHEATAHRQQFAPLSRTYLRRQWEFLHPQGWLQLFMGYHQNRAIAGIWHTAFGDSVTSRIAAWAGEAANLRPYIACHWSAIQWAKGAGYRYYDFGDLDYRFAELLIANQPITGDLLLSPSAFKYYFGGDLVLLPKPRQFTFNPIARAVTRPFFSLIADRPAFRRLVHRFRNG